MSTNPTRKKQYLPIDSTSVPCRLLVVFGRFHVVSGRFHVGLTSLSTTLSTPTQTSNPM